MTVPSGPADGVATLAAELTKLAQDTLHYPVRAADEMVALFSAAGTALNHDVTWAKPFLSASYFPVVDQDDFAVKCERFLRGAEVQAHMAADPEKMH